MILTIESIKSKINSYLNNDISLRGLRNWSFNCIASDDIDFNKTDQNLISEILFLIDDESVKKNLLKQYLIHILKELNKPNSISEKEKSIKSIRL